MFFKESSSFPAVFCLTVCCLLFPSEGNEIVLQQNADDISITPGTFPNETTDRSSITITAPKNFRVLLKFVSVQLEKGSLDLYNRIGIERMSQCILTVSRRLHPPPPHLISPGQQLLILFSHGSHQMSEGLFLLNATLVEKKACAIELGPGETRNITSPSYPDDYPRPAFSFITIAAPSGCRLKYRFLANDIAHEDTLCISERREALNTDSCDIIKIGTVRIRSGNFASLWFGSDLSSTGRGFLVSFTSIGQSDDTPCTQPSYHAFGLSPAPGVYSPNTANKPTRKKRANQNISGDISELPSQPTETTPKPWYQYPLLQLAGVLLAVVVIGVLINQLTRHLLDLCCQTKQRVTMTTSSPPQSMNRPRTKSWGFPSWKLGDRKSRYTVNSSDDLAVATGKGDGKLGGTDIRETDYITMGRIETSSRDLPRRNPSAVSETSRSDNIKLQGTEGETMAGTHAHSGTITRMTKKGASESPPDPDDDPDQQSRDLSSPRCGDEKPAVPTMHRKSQSSLLEGDTYITGKFVSDDIHDSGTPNQRAVFKQPSSVSHVRPREQSSFNSLVAFNKRASISMFDLTDNDPEDHFGLDTQLGLHGQNTSNELVQQSYNPRMEPSLTRRREYDGLTSYQGRIADPGNRTHFEDTTGFTPKDQSISSSTDSLPMTCVDEGVQWYSPIEQENQIARKEDRYSSAMTKFDILCNSLQADVEDISSELATYANLPPLNRKRFATVRGPGRSKPIYLKTSKVVQRSQSTSAHDLTVSSSGTPGIDYSTKSNLTDNTSLSNTSSFQAPPPNLLSSCLRNPVSMERRVTSSGGSHTTFGKPDRVISAYRSYCEIDDIEPGCGVESLGVVTDPRGYNLTNICLGNE